MEGVTYTAYEKFQVWSARFLVISFSVNATVNFFNGAWVRGVFCIGMVLGFVALSGRRYILWMRHGREVGKRRIREREEGKRRSPHVREERKRRSTHVRALVTWVVGLVFLLSVGYWLSDRWWSVGSIGIGWTLCAFWILPKEEAQWNDEQWNDETPSKKPEPYVFTTRASGRAADEAR